MKYLFRLFILTMLFMGSVPVKATSNNLGISEYAMDSEFAILLQEIERFDSNTVLSLKEDYNEYLELIRIKKQYLDFLYKQKELSSEELQKQNYTETQINAIHSFDGTDELALLASAYVQISAATRTHTSSLHGVRFSWSWIGTPSLTGVGIVDGVAIRWSGCDKNGNIIKLVKDSKTSAFVRYGSKKETRTIDYAPTTNSVEIRFVMAGLDGEKLTYADSGVFDIYLTIPSSTTAKIAYSDYNMVYAHPTFTSGGVSFSYPAGLGIEVSIGKKEQVKSWQVNT